MCGQNKISPNGSISKAEYSGINCLLLEFICDDKLDTSFEKFEEFDRVGVVPDDCFRNFY